MSRVNQHLLWHWDKVSVFCMECCLKPPALAPDSVRFTVIPQSAGKGCSAFSCARCLFGSPVAGASGRKEAAAGRTCGTTLTAGAPSGSHAQRRLPAFGVRLRVCRTAGRKRAECFAQLVNSVKLL